MNVVGLGVEAENLTDSVWEIRRMKCGDEQITVLAARPGAVSVNHPPPPLVTVWGNVTLRPPPVLTAPPPARIDPIQARPAAVKIPPPVSLDTATWRRSLTVYIRYIQFDHTYIKRKNFFNKFEKSP